MDYAACSLPGASRRRTIIGNDLSILSIVELLERKALSSKIGCGPSPSSLLFTGRSAEAGLDLTSSLSQSVSQLPKPK